MEIRIECVCGQPFAFEVEPVNGQMPCEINCPACGVSATAQANQLIRKQSPPPPPVPMATRPIAAARPAPASVAPAKLPEIDYEAAQRPAKAKSREGTAFRNGLIAAAICAVLGMIVWCSMILFLHIEIGWVAWGVGAFIGLGARIFGEGGSTLGALCALFAAIVIVGGHVLLTDLSQFRPLIIVFLALAVASAYKIGAGGD